MTFNFDLQKYQAKKKVTDIQKVFNERMRKLDESESHMGQLVELKIASFFYYLRHYKLRGYGKWTVLSNCVKEMHPQDLSLLDLVINKMKDDEIF